MCSHYFSDPIGTIGKDIKKAINNPLQTIGDIAATATGNPELVPFINAGNVLLKGGSIGQAAANGVGSYAGGQLGAGLFGSGNVQGPGGTVGSAFGDLGSAGNYISQNLPASVAGAQLAGSLGSAAGSALGGGISDNLTGVGSSKGTGSPSITPGAWSTQSTMPSSLSGYAGLSPGQVSSNIATQGVYGGGEGPQEQDYFLNLINSRLNGDANTQLSPIEQSYLSQLGLGGSTSNQNLQSKLQAYQG